MKDERWVFRFELIHGLPQRINQNPTTHCFPTLYSLPEIQSVAKTA
jgi:hypothetical protein